MKYKNNTYEQLHRKIFFSTFLLSLYYFIAPLLFFSKLQSIPFYAPFRLEIGLIALQSFSAIVVLLLVYFSTKRTKLLINSYHYSVKLKEINKKISNWTVLIMCLSSLPLALKLAGGLSDRTDSYSYVLDLRQNVVLSVIFTLALVSSTLLYLDDKKRNMLLLSILVVLPELMFGTRVSAFRMLFVFLIFSSWKIKNLMIPVLILLLIGFSRAIFNGYSASSLTDFLILFAGDPLNITLGTSLLYNSDGVNCGIDGLHVLRAALPPVWVRQFFDPYIGDVTVCINSARFGGSGAYGLGGSASNDLLAAPVSLCIFAITLLIISRTKWFDKIHPIISVYIPIVVLTCAPYIMRNGLIATSNHVITVVLWVLIPLLLVIKRPRGLPL